MTLAMIGSGLMGGGIALDAARHGLDVLVYDARPDGLARLKERAAGVYACWVKNGRMTQEAADAALARLLPAPTLAEVGEADIVIEAVFEDLSVKRAVFADLAPHLGADTVVATNTSALRVAALAEGFDFADRVLGLHYFSPAEVCPLVEVVRATQTGEAAITGAMTFSPRRVARRWLAPTRPASPSTASSAPITTRQRASRRMASPHRSRLTSSRASGSAWQPARSLS